MVAGIAGSVLYGVAKRPMPWLCFSHAALNGGLRANSLISPIFRFWPIATITPSTFTRQIKTWEERRLALIRKARGQAA